VIPAVQPPPHFNRPPAAQRLAVRQRWRALPRTAAVLAAIFLSRGVLAAPACTVRTTALAFGAYDTVNSLSGATSITVRCARINQGAGGTVAYTIALSAGPGSYAARHMAGGANVLLYNLYTDLPHTLVWGDGSGGSVTVSGTFTTPPTTQTQRLTVYGLIPGNQNVVPRGYRTASPITITMTY